MSLEVLGNKARVGEAWPFTCPVCDEPLVEVPGALRCRAGHSFDVARDGYVNLLTDKHAERGISGDTLEMLHARRRFLDTNPFNPLLDALSAEVATALDSVETARKCVVDVGCGEGYYAGNLAAGAPSSGDSDVRFVGFDVSKPATRLAARRYKHARFAVANVRRRLYVHAGSVSVLLSVFAPRNVSEIRRVLSSTGSLIIVVPSPRHMQSLRELYQLLQVEDTKEERVLAQFHDHFTVESHRAIEYPIHLSHEQVRDFIAMGPNAYHLDGTPTPEQGTQTLASFVLLRLRH